MFNNSLLHSKDYIGRLHADGQLFNLLSGYQLNLLMKDFKFAITGKSTTVAQKGGILEEPFHTMPTASVSFSTYIKAPHDDKDYDLIAIFSQLAREQSNVTLVVANRNFSSFLLRGDGIFNSIQIAGRAGSFLMAQIMITLSNYRHSKDGLAQLMTV